MRIEHNGLAYSRVQQPQRQGAGQAAEFDRMAQAAQSAPVQETQSAEPAQGASQIQSLSMAEPVRQPLSQYLSVEEKAMLGALFPAVEKGYGVGAYAQSQFPGAAASVRGQAIDLSS